MHDEAAVTGGRRAATRASTACRAGWPAAVAVAVATLAVPASGQTPERPCLSGEHRRLDFRLGTFRVTTHDGVRAGKSEVAVVLDGCAITETWVGAVSGKGRGTTFYDASAGVWRMVYVSDDGNSLTLAGRFEGRALVLTGRNRSFDGRLGRHRMTWSPLPLDGVRQLWELSLDGGKTWERIFDGRHARVRGGLQR